MSDAYDIFTKEQLVAVLRCKDQTISDKDQTIGKLQEKLKDYKGKYHELRNIEVVRSEIENYEDIWLFGFVEDTTQSSKFSGYKKSREIRRQKWLHILLSSTYQHVIFLRNLILLHGVRLSYLTWFNESRYKQLRKLQGYHRQVELIKLKVKYLEQLKKDTFLSALLSFIKTPNIQPTDANFIHWYQGEFKTFAQNISEIYSSISDIIHNAKVDINDTIPSEYQILRKPEYDACINMIMSFYSVSLPPAP